jgi:hypothetical protein
MKINASSEVFSFGMSLLITLSCASSTLAVDAFVPSESKPQWSKVVEHPTDGPIVYDRNFRKSNRLDFCMRNCKDEMEVLSSWSKSGIRFTYIYSKPVITGYQTNQYTREVFDYTDGYGNNYYRTEVYYQDDPIYSRDGVTGSPKALLFSINGQTFSYTSGPVPQVLADALAKLPENKFRLQLVWEDGSTTDADIGKGTVRAWKQIFQ